MLPRFTLKALIKSGIIEKLRYDHLEFNKGPFFNNIDFLSSGKMSSESVDWNTATVYINVEGTEPPLLKKENYNFFTSN